MADHTPTPWKMLTDRKGTGAEIEGKYGGIIAELYSLGTYKGVPEWRENGHHIVVCVNSHAAMVEILGKIIHWADNRYVDAANPMPWPDSLDMQARATLAKAKA